MVLKMFKETDWRKMHIFRLQAAVGKGLVSQALGKSQKGHGTEPAGLKGSWNICANWWTSWKLFFFLNLLHSDNVTGNESWLLQFLGHTILTLTVIILSCSVDT